MAEDSNGEVIVLKLDAAGRVVLQEGEGLAAVLAGEAARSLVGRSLSDIAEIRPEVLEGLKRGLAGHSSRASIQVDHRQFEMRFSPRKSAEGLITGCVLVGIAITDHDRRSLVRRGDLGLRLLFRQIPGAIWATDRQLRITYSTGRLQGDAGVDAKAIVGTTVPEFVGTSDPNHPAIANSLGALAGERRSFYYDFRGRSYAVHLEPLFEGGSRVVGSVGVAVDVTEQHEVERKLRESERQLADAQRVAHVGSWEWDVADNVVTWSAELRRIYGLSPSIVPRTYQDLLSKVHPDDLAHTKQMVEACLESGTPAAYDYRIIRPDGEIRMLHTQCEAIRDSGRTVRLIGSCWDITNQWSTGKKLERSNSLLRATLEATADGLLVSDLEGKIAAYNSRFRTLWKIPSDLLEGRDDDAMLHYVLDQLQDPSSFLERVREIYSQPESDAFDVVRFKDGRVFERYAIPQRLGSQVVGRVWSFRDVTDRERLLRRALFLADAGRLLGSLDVEPALEATAQLTLGFLGDACAIDLFVGGQGPRRLVAIGRDPSRQLPTEVPRVVFAGHSAIYNVGSRSYMAVPLLAHGDLLGAIIFLAIEGVRYGQADLRLAEDLAHRAELAIENARLYRGAKEALASRDEFLAIAAHEIRGPVTSLHLAVQSLKRDWPPSGDLRKTLGIIEREDRRIVQLVDELLDMARIRAGRLHFAFQEVDLAEVTREVISRLSPELSRSGSSLSVSSPGSVVGIWDRTRIDQVATNLLSNAIKFGLGKPIDVMVSGDGRIARLTIRDRGMGIAKDQQQRIFRPFERVVSARNYGGLGLGLYIVRTIVEGLGGSIVLESEPGVGTTVTIALPQTRARS